MQLGVIRALTDATTTLLLMHKGSRTIRRQTHIDLKMLKLSRLCRIGEKYDDVDDRKVVVVFNCHFLLHFFICFYYYFFVRLCLLQADSVVAFLLFYCMCI